MHSSLNGTGALSIMVITGGNDLTVGITGLAGLIVLAIVDIGIFAYDRYLAKEPITSP